MRGHRSIRYAPDVLEDPYYSHARSPRSPSRSPCWLRKQLVGVFTRPIRAECISDRNSELSLQTSIHYIPPPPCKAPAFQQWRSEAEEMNLARPRITQHPAGSPAQEFAISSWLAVSGLCSPPEHSAAPGRLHPPMKRRLLWFWRLVRMFR